MDLFSPLKEWRSCVRVWHEWLLRRPVAHLCVELSEEFVLVIPCPGLDRRLTTADVRTLAGLIGRWKLDWKGPATQRRLETTGRTRRSEVGVRELGGGVFVVGDGFCIEDGSILLFDEPIHMRLYVSVVEHGLHPLTFRSLCSVLTIERAGRHSDARLVRYSNVCVDRLRSPMLWKTLAAVMWPGVEVVSTDRWHAERCHAATSIEAIVDSVVVEQAPVILVERDAAGRHFRCLLVLVRTNMWRADAGSVLFISYVAYESRVYFSMHGGS
jgi:hypothetical protein